MASLNEIFNGEVDKAAKKKASPRPAPDKQREEKKNEPAGNN